jgi:hypothetical protein
MVVEGLKKKKEKKNDVGTGLLRGSKVTLALIKSLFAVIDFLFFLLLILKKKLVQQGQCYE